MNVVPHFSSPLPLLLSYLCSTRFALLKLFTSCTKLEEIDISNFLNVGDDEIRLLAQSCPNLLTFNAKHSHHLSDQSVLALSKHCPDLDFVDVTRQSYSYKISDVCLLALGV